MSGSTQKITVLVHEHEHENVDDHDQVNVMVIVFVFVILNVSDYAVSFVSIAAIRTSRALRKAFGFRTFEALEIALYHQLGELPVPQLATAYHAAKALQCSGSLLESELRKESASKGSIHGYVEVLRHHSS